MKKYLLLLIITTIAGCNGKKESQETPIKQTSVATVVDLTDAKTLKLWPKVKPILGLYRSAKFPKQACKFSITAISDLKNNPLYYAFLPDAIETEKQNRNDDMQWRSRVIRGYFDDVYKLMDKFYQENDTSINRGHSEVWETMARSLENLSEEPDGEKYLLVYSDLQEMSLAGNAYKSFQTMSIEAIVKKLADAHPVPKNIKKINVVVVYQPVNREDDLRFNKIFKVYKTILEAEGASVTSQSTIDEFEK
ncbi:hypothetical protein [Ferruginibacter sp.]|nr:hypothetical protein [Ferruginibacter sp.]